jgi:hypothetical protein
LLGCLLALGLLAGTTDVRGAIHLEWRPGAQIVNLGSTVDVGLYAVSDSALDQSVSAADVILDWDPAYLALTGVLDNGPYAWLSSSFPNDAGLDGLNNTWLDGDALYLAMAQLGTPAQASPAGLLVTTFQFTALDLTAGTLLSIPASEGSFTNTRVFDGVTPGLEVQGDLGTALITIVPEPGLLGLVSAGALVALRRRR